MVRRLFLVIGFAMAIALGFGGTLALAQEADDEAYAEDESDEGSDESDEESSGDEVADDEAAADEETEDQGFDEGEVASEEAAPLEDESADAMSESDAVDEEPSVPEPPSSPPQPKSEPVQPAPAQQRSASGDEQEDTTIYKVVMNHEEQYSIWPADRENPAGWTDAGKTGSKAECLEYIQNVWIDMRPLSLRKKMEEAERARGDQ